jgi:pimeloyl-ACP methyl ester carboxylesterase
MVFCSGDVMKPEIVHKTLIRADGCHLSYAMADHGAETSVMLIHGALCNGATLRSVYPIHDCNVLWPDLRGHGRSTSGNRPWSLDLLAQDMIAIVEAERITRLVLAGESFGALVAARMAALIPDQVKLLVCSEPPLSPARLTAVRTAILSARQSVCQSTAEELARLLGYDDDQPNSAHNITFHRLLTTLPMSATLLYGTGGQGAFASVIDNHDLTMLAHCPSIILLPVQGADHLVLRSVGGSLLRALQTGSG